MLKVRHLADYGGEVIRVARDGTQQVRDAMLEALSEDDVLRLD